MERRSLRVLVFAVFCLVIGGLAWSGALWVEKMPSRLAAAAEELLKEKALRLGAQFFSLAGFQPRLRVNHRVISESRSEIAEIALLEKEIEVENEFVHTWAGSTKTLRLRGKYVVKGGYNVSDRIEIQVERGQTRVLLPPAVILSVEQKDLQVEALENGLWNPVSADDLQSSIATLQALAKSRGQPLLKDMEASFANRLRRLLGENVEVRELRPYMNGL